VVIWELLIIFSRTFSKCLGNAR